MDFSSITDPAKEILPRLPQAVLILVVGFFAINTVKFFAQKFLKIFKKNQEIGDILITIGVVFFWIILAIFVLKSLGFTGLAIAVSGSAVVIGLAIATGARELTSDIIAGIFLSTDKDFQIGNTVRTVKKSTRVEGKIESIDIRKIRIRDKKNMLHIIPNSILEKESWTIVKRKRGRNK